MKPIFALLFCLLGLNSFTQTIYFRPSAGYGWQYTHLRNTDDFIKPYRKGQIDMALWMEYRNKKNTGFLAGVGEGLSYSGFYVGPKITGTNSRGVYVRAWGPPYTRVYAGIEFPVKFLYQKDRYHSSLRTPLQKRSQFFLGAGLSVNFYNGGKGGLNPSGVVIQGKDDFFAGGSIQNLPRPKTIPSAWLRFRYQHYSKKGKENWSLLAMLHYAPFRPMYQDEIYFETRSGSHTALNTNRALHFVVSFSYPIRLWQKKSKKLLDFRTE